MEICVFTKHFQEYDAERLGLVMKDLGVWVEITTLIIPGHGHMFQNFRKRQDK